MLPRTLFLLSLLAVKAHAATLVVAPGGPFPTIGRAVSAARAGDVVEVREGVYRESVVVQRGGTPDAPLIVRARRGETAVIDASGLSGPEGQPADGLTIAADHVQVIGLEIRNAPGTGLVAWGAHDVRIAGNRVHGSRRSGIWVGHDERNRAYDVTVEDNVIYDNVRENERRAWDAGWGQSIGVSRARRVIVRGNMVHHNYGEGILLTKSKDCRVTGNEVFDNFSVQIYLTYVQRTRVEGNFTYSSGDEDYYRDGQPASGIMLANETERVLEEATAANVVTGNVVLHSRWGISYWNRTPHGMRNTTIASNTVAGATEHLLHIDPDPNNHGNLVEHNVFFREPGSDIQPANVPAGAARFRGNCWSAEPEEDARGEGDVIGDPRFVRPGGTRAGDYRLRSSSPCRAMGAPGPGAHEN